LRALIENGFNVAAIVTKPDTPRGRHRVLTAPAVKVYAAEHNIPVWQPTKLKNIINDIKLIKNPAGVLNYSAKCYQSIHSWHHQRPSFSPAKVPRFITN